MAAVLFKDLQKRSSDLLTKEYPSDKSEVKTEWKGSTGSGIDFETTVTRDKSGNVVGNLKEKYLVPQYNAEVTGEINTNKDAKLEVAVKETLKGLKTTVSGHSKGNDVFTAFSVEYKHPHFTFNGNVDYANPKGSCVEGAATSVYNGVSLGIFANWGLASQSLNNFKTLLAYRSKDFDTAVSGSVVSKGGKTQNLVGVSYFHQINSQIQAGGEIVADTSSETKPLLTFGSAYKLSNDSTVKVKLDTVGKLGLSLVQQINNNTKLTLADRKSVV